MRFGDDLETNEDAVREHVRALGQARLAHLPDEDECLH